MILTDLFESQEIHDQDRLDSVLERCLELLHDKRREHPGKYGKVAACIIDMKNRKVFGVNSPGPNGTRRHAERVALDKYHERYGKILPGAIIVTTLSPCNRPMAERDGPSCQDLLMKAGIEKVYAGYMDPSQHSDHSFTEEVTKNDDIWAACKALSDSFVHDDLAEGKKYPIPLPIGDYLGDDSEEFAPPGNYKDTTVLHNNVFGLVRAGVEPKVVTMDPKRLLATQDWLRDGGGYGPLLPEYANKPVVYKKAGKYYILDGHHRTTKAVKAGQPISVYLFSDEQALDENFADGKHPEDKGDSKRYGVPTKASVSTLRKVAKQGGRKGQLAHWMANMKAGRAKARKK